MNILAERAGGKPSLIMEAMIRGLLKADKRKTFKVNMITFGYSEQGVCFGCAATTTVMEVTNTRFDASSINSCEGRSDFIGLDKAQLIEFEYAVDAARTGRLEGLFEICGMPEINAASHLELTFFDFYMLNANWRESLPEVRKCIDKLKKGGF